MNAILFAAGLIVSPPTANAADTHLDALFLAQRQEIVQEIREETRLDLHHQSLHFFAPDGELRRQLVANGAIDAKFAAR
ncbi:MAG TPA: hypothetical protein VF275_05585 [Gammaproteobacteria bacterium]